MTPFTIVSALCLMALISFVLIAVLLGRQKSLTEQWRKEAREQDDRRLYYECFLDLVTEMQTRPFFQQPFQVVDVKRIPGPYARTLRAARGGLTCLLTLRYDPDRRCTHGSKYPMEVSVRFERESLYWEDGLSREPGELIKRIEQGVINRLREDATKVEDRRNKGLTLEDLERSLP